MNRQIPFDLSALLAECNSSVSPQGFQGKLDLLYDFLCKENASTNLTRISSYGEYWNKHIADSLLFGAYFPRLTTQESAVVDIGCGAGFPSLVLAVAFPNLMIDAVDSIAKKSSFVSDAAELLGLSTLRVSTGRARELNRKEKWRGKFDIVTARAVANIAIIFRETRAMLKPDGKFILYKTPEQVAEELPEIEKISAKYSFSWSSSSIYELPAGGGMRQFIIGSRK